MERRTFKQGWNKTDEVCSHCGQVTKFNRGLTKQNVKKLFRKPTMQEGIILIMIVLVLFGALAYQSEVKEYKNIIRYPGELCQIYYESILRGNFANINIFNISNVEIIENERIN